MGEAKQRRDAGTLGTPKTAKGTTGREPHISQLNPAKRALADQSIRDALLAIVTAQGKPVSIPIDHLDRISEQYRLKIELDDGKVTLTSEKVSPKIIEGRRVPDAI